MIRFADWPPKELPQNLVDSVDDSRWDHLKKYFPKFDYWNDPDGRCLYSRPDNWTGFQQRAFEIYWTLRGVDGGGIGLAVGSSSVIPPFSIGIDKYNGEHPYYSNPTWGYATMECLGEKLPFFDEQFDVVTSIHSFEHMENPTETLAEWLRVLKRGESYIAIVAPDNSYNDVMEIDKDHKWAPDEQTLTDVCMGAIDLTKSRDNSGEIDILYINTMQNGFSIDAVLCKR